MYNRHLSWVYLPAFLVFVILFSGVSSDPARAAMDPDTVSVRTPASEKTGNDLFSSTSRRGNLNWSNDPTVVRSRFVDVKASLLSGTEGPQAGALRGGAVVDLNFFDGVAFSAALERFDPLDSGGFTWVGRLEGVDLSLVTFVVRNGIIMGDISLPGGVMYQVRYAGNGVHAVREVDQKAFPPEAEPIPVELRPDAQDSGTFDPLAAADDGSTIDVLVVYTPSARTAAGGTDAMEAMIALAVSETNTGYGNSGIYQRLNLVHTAEVDYTEDVLGMEQDLNHVTHPSDGYMDSVHTLRNTYCADEVVLIVDSLQYCGIAWMMSYVSSSFASSAFAAVSVYCAAGYYSFGHELGHNMGANHDWFVSSSTQPYPYAHGYTYLPDQWRTVMAYNSACSTVGGCTRLPYWSNPNVTYGGVPMGVPEGQSQPADNRKTLNNTALTVANFRQSCSGAPPAAASPISPTGTIHQPGPAYNWGSVAESTEYYLNVTGPGGTVIQTSYASADVCSGDICSVTPATSLVSGNYIWKVQTWNSYGFGPWSTDTSFTVNMSSEGDAAHHILLILLDILLGED